MPLPRTHRWLLRLLPPELRARYGADVDALLADLLDDARVRGRLAYLRTWTATAWDIVTRARHERVHRQHAGPFTQELSMVSLLTDVRYALRTFARQKGATALVAGTLALAVAANVAVFALVDGMFFRPFPFPDSDRLVYVNQRAPAWNLEFTGINYPDFVVWRDRVERFEGIAAWQERRMSIADGEGATQVPAALVTHDLGEVLGIQPVAGRFFTPDEDRPDAPRVAMLGHRLWLGQFGGAGDVVGRTVRIDGRPHQIVGVLPPEANFPREVNLWVPLREDPRATGQSYSYDGIGRLRPGVSLAEARADLERAHAPVWRERDTARVVSPLVMPLRDRLVSDVRDMGRIMALAVLLVLVVACANVASAMLARATARRREFGIRMALGADRARVTRQLLTESLLLAGAAGVVGVIAGRVVLALILRLPGEAPPAWLQLQLDWRTGLFAVAIVTITALLFGLLPAGDLRRQNLRSAVGEGARTGDTPGQRRLLGVLVVVEVAMAAVLLVGGTLLVRTYRHLQQVEPGFRTEGVATFRLSLPAVRYRDGRETAQFHERLVDRIAALPGVTSAGTITCPPLTCHWGNFFEAEGAAPRRAGEGSPVTLMRVGTAGALQALQIPLLRGRYFTDGEAKPDGFQPVVVNESFARLHWPGVADPTGRRVGQAGDSAGYTVVGVTRDDRHYGLVEPARPAILMARASFDTSHLFTGMAIVAHTRDDPATLLASTRRIVAELDPELPVFDARTMDQLLARSLVNQRLTMTVVGAFAMITVALALGGIYALLGYVVSRRRREIGIRMALGARREQVVSLVVRQGLGLAMIGLALGLPLALVAARAMGSVLVGVSALDPLTYLGTAVLLGGAAVVAALVPARRAAKVPPTIALEG